MDKHITKGLDIFKKYDPMISLRTHDRGELWWKVSVYCLHEVSKKHKEKLEELGWANEGPEYFTYTEYKGGR
jgi:hypothetical protein